VLEELLKIDTCSSEIVTNILPEDENNPHVLCHVNFMLHRQYCCFLESKFYLIADIHEEQRHSTCQMEYVNMRHSSVLDDYITITVLDVKTGFCLRLQVGPKTETSPFRFHLKTEIESSLQYFMFQMKDGTMDDVQNGDTYTILIYHHHKPVDLNAKDDNRVQ
jgi:hypothetical protein